MRGTSARNITILHQTSKLLSSQGNDEFPQKSQVHVLALDPEHEGRRLDNVLLALLKPIPRSLVYKLLRSGQVRVNSSRVRPDYRVRAGDNLRLPPVHPVNRGGTATPSGHLIESLERRILFEDHDYVVINKPAGMACHSGTGIAHGVIETLRAGRPGAQRLDLAHRLDRETSGCLVVCKNLDALRAVQASMHAGELGKRYVAFVKGHLPNRRRQINVDLSIQRNRHGKRNVEATQGGRKATTIVELTETVGAHSLVFLTLLTGRMHQIRAHVSHIGHPIGGDSMYGDPAFNKELAELGLRRMFLHANRISLPSGGGTRDVEAPLPVEFERAVAALCGSLPAPA